MRILLTHPPDTRGNYYPDAALAELRTLGEVRLNPGAAVLAGQALVEAARGCTLVVTDRQTAVPAGFFEAAADVRAVLRCAVDIRNIDIPAASTTGVLVTRATPGFADAVAELAVGFMIDLARGVTAAVAAYRSGSAPEVRMGMQLRGSTLGIIGLGVIGRRLATLAQGLGMLVIATDPAPVAMEDGIERVSMTNLLARSRFVVCLAPATPQTEKLMDATAFAAMRPDAFFLNLSRGDLVDESALAAALDAGRLAGAALDVGRAPDQMPSDVLARRPDVLATPHIGGLTAEAVAHQAFDTVRQVAEILAGREPPGAVNWNDARRLRDARGDRI